MQKMLRPLDCLLFLRVAATFMVVIGHTAAFLKGLQFTQWPYFPYIQSISVVLFFAVSGYTIAWVIDNKDDGFWRFIYDRAARLLIPLVPVLIALALIEPLYFAGKPHPTPDALTLKTFFGNVAFLQSFPATGIPPFGLARPLWTLAQEFWIYIAFGSFAFAIKRQPSITAIIAGFFAIYLLYPLILGGYGQGLPIIWLLGATFYYATKQLPALTGAQRLAILPVFGIALSLFFDKKYWPSNGSYSPTFNLLVFAIFAITLIVTSGLPLNRRVKQAATFMGSFAYTVYLVHYPLVYMIRGIGIFSANWISVATVSVLSFFVAWVVSIPFEQKYKPVRDWIWETVARKLVKTVA
jgi:peptidoglycan/LPS O-acetylase OafA/YrhL